MWCACVCARASVYMSIGVCMCVCTYVCVHVCVCVCVYVYKCVYMCVCVWVSTSACVCTCIYVCTCACVLSSLQSPKMNKNKQYFTGEGVSIWQIRARRTVQLRDVDDIKSCKGSLLGSGMVETFKFRLNWHIGEQLGPKTVLHQKTAILAWTTQGQ